MLDLLARFVHAESIGASRLHMHIRRRAGQQRVDKSFVAIGQHVLRASARLCHRQQSLAHLLLQRRAEHSMLPNVQE